MKYVACPHCGNRVLWDASSRWRPFCSERCRVMDLGAWASESYAIPAHESFSVETDPVKEDLADH